MKFSTSTLVDEKFVPWLASSGGLAYSPHAPPEREYFFQYSWVIPAIFRFGVNLRRHFWFGSQWKDSPDVRLSVQSEVEFHIWAIWVRTPSRP